MEFLAKLVYPFFDLYYRTVKDVESENRMLRSGSQRLMEELSPEAKRRLFIREVGELVRATALLEQCGGRQMPLETLRAYIRIIWENFYENTAAAMKDASYWTKKYIEKITGKRISS